jgi:hypothetical protein
MRAPQLRASRKQAFERVTSFEIPPLVLTYTQYDTTNRLLAQLLTVLGGIALTLAIVPGMARAVLSF